MIDGNPLGDEGGLALAQLVERHGALRRLSAARCELRTDALIALASSLARTRTLAALDISEPRLFSRNEETTYHVARALRSNLTVGHLAMRKHPHMSDSGVASLCDFLLDNSAAAAAAASDPAAGPGVLSLDLSSNRLGPPSGVTLAKAFESGLALRRLDLSRCRIGDEGAVALARAFVALGTAARLESLDLRSCSIGDEGEEAIAEWLTSDACSLREIRLFGNGNEAGARGTTALGVAIMSGAVRCAVDLKPYVVDGAMMLAHQDVE